MVCLTPAGNLWLLLEESGLLTCWFNLETGEVREMMRSVPELIKYGWEVVP